MRTKKRVRARNEARRLPKQERSKQTVDVLLQGTARVLVKEGYDRASTNRIAAAAGVNIGSLYQYFPSKEALVAALIDRNLATLQELLHSTAEAQAHLPIEELIRILIRAYIDLSKVNPALNRVLVQQVPRVERLNPIMTLRRQIIDRTRELLEAHRDRLRVIDPARAAFIAVHLVDALTQAAILEHPEYLSDEAYVDDMTRIVMGYLGVKG